MRAWKFSVEKMIKTMIWDFLDLCVKSQFGGYGCTVTFFSCSGVNNGSFGM